jgi:putative transposase
VSSASCVQRKSHKHLLAHPALKFQFIAEHHQEYPVTVMCDALEVSVSGFYAWCHREPSHHRREDADITEKIKEVFYNYRGIYRSPRIHAELHAQGLACARKRVARLMQEQELAAKRPRHRTVTTHAEGGATFAPNAAISRTFMRMSRIRNGPVIRPTSGPGKGGCFLRSCLTCFHAW